MRTVLVNSSDIQGGAARAAYRLHQGFQSIHIESEMLVLLKASQDPNVIQLSGRIAALRRRTGWRLDLYPIKLYPKRDKTQFWSLNLIPFPMAKHIIKNGADILHFHWIGAGFVPIVSMRGLNKPIVWTLHDEWAFTGGCHYASNCDHFTRQCGQCPQLGSIHENDVSRWIWRSKAAHWESLNLTIVAPSRWLAERARSSSLFRSRRIEVIPNGIDTSVFQPVDQVIARERFQLPPDKKLILFGAVNSTGDPRKGFDHLMAALQRLAEKGWADTTDVVIFGSRAGSDRVMGFNAHYLGIIQDERDLALAYSAADVFVLPSRQENLPNTVMESLACARPVVGFDIGGMPDMIEHQWNGYLVAPYHTDDFARGIEWVLEDHARWSCLGENGRQKVLSHFEITHVARHYAALYEQILQNSPGLEETF